MVFITGGVNGNSNVYLMCGNYLGMVVALMKGLQGLVSHMELEYMSGGTGGGDIGSGSRSIHSSNVKIVSGVHMRSNGHVTHSHLFSTCSPYGNSIWDLVVVYLCVLNLCFRQYSVFVM